MILEHSVDANILVVQGDEVNYNSAPLSATHRRLASTPASTNIKRQGPAPPSTQKISSSFGPLWTQRRTRHAVIAAESVLNTVPTAVPKPALLRNLLTEAIKPCLLFQGLPPLALEVIVDTMTLLEVSKGAMIISQGDTKACHEFFVIESGSCDVLIRPENTASSSLFLPSLPNKVATYSSGQAFGELALLYSAPRAASVRATTKCRLWVLQRSALFAIKKNFCERQNVERHALLSTVPLLKHLSPHHRALLVDALVQASDHHDTHKR